MPIFALKDKYTRLMRNWRASLRPKWALMPRCNADLLAETLFLCASIFEQAGVLYTIHHGCLLGATRLEGLLPWDIDADLFLLNETGNSFRAKTTALLSQHGLLLEERQENRYFVIRPAVAIGGHSIALYPIIEVDLLQEGRNSLGEAVYDQHAWHRRWDAGELLPLRRHRFCGSWLAGPHSAEPVLERLYQGAGSVAALRAFSPAPLGYSTESFWQIARPFDADMDWPAISLRAKRLRRSILWRCAICAPWYFLNSLYCIFVQTLRRAAGGHLE